MRFLLDVNVGSRVAWALSGLGHEVARAALLYREWDDAELLALAVEEDRIIVSRDSDFTDLIYAFGHAAPRSLIYVRDEDGEKMDVVARVIEALDSPLLDGHMVVIKHANTRFRPFPAASNDNG